MTTGGPDTADVYEEEVRDGKYRFKDEWRPLEVRTERIPVKVGNEIKVQEVRIESTHHGPIVVQKNGKSYAAAIPYANEFRLLEQMWSMDSARNLAEMKKALAGLQFMSQNIMVGTVAGDIYYVRNGRVPIRPKGCDTSRPLPGASGECEWHGTHPFADLVQITNPPQGYMQNCNVSPFAMMKDSPAGAGEMGGAPLPVQRRPAAGASAGGDGAGLLDGAKNVTAEEAIEIAFSPQVWHAELWQERSRAVDSSGDFARLLAGWNRRSDAGGGVPQAAA